MVLESDLYQPTDASAAESQYGLLVFLPAAIAAVGLTAYWLHRIRHPDVHQRLLAGPLPVRIAPHVPRPYSMYDLIASCGTGFLLNLCITIVVPVALSSAETRGHSAPLTVSGTVAAATSIGMIVSVAFMYPWPESLMDSKMPALFFAGLMLVGNLAYLAVEHARLQFAYLLACRVIMALGFGAGYAAKRRAGFEPDPKRREYLFMLLELACSVGMACGPLLTGGMALLLPHRSLLIPPAITSVLSFAFLLALLLCPLDAPFTFSLPQTKPEHSGPLDDGTQMLSSPRGGGGGTAAAPRPPRAESTPLVGPAAAGRPPVWVAATVQLTCLLFGVTRNFLKFGFESAMVVVYDRQIMLSEGASGLVAGLCAMSAVLMLALYRTVCVGRFATSTLLLVSEAPGRAENSSCDRFTCPLGGALGSGRSYTPRRAASAA